MGVLWGRYRLDRKVASSATTELFVATISGEQGFQKQVHLERLTTTADASSTARFVQAAKLSAQLSHPKIVQTLELSSVANRRYVTRELVDGFDALTLLSELARAGKTLEPALCAWVAQEVLDALDYAHTHTERGAVIHGRISLSSVMLGVHGDVKLGEFGASPDLQLDTPNAKADLGHTSPEHVMGHAVDARTDTFLIGVVLAELLIGHQLFTAEQEQDVLARVRDVELGTFDSDVARVDAALVEIVRTALRKDPAERWQSAALFRDALGDWLFEHRHRTMRPQIARIIVETRAVIMERSKQEPQAPPIPAADRAPPIPEPIKGGATTKVLSVAPPPRTLTPPTGISTRRVRIPTLPPFPGKRTKQFAAAVPEPAPVAVPPQPPAPAAPVAPEAPAEPPGDTAIPVALPERAPSEPEIRATAIGMPPLREPGLVFSEIPDEQPPGEFQKKRSSSKGIKPLREPQRDRVSTGGKLHPQRKSDSVKPIASEPSVVVSTPPVPVPPPVPPPVPAQVTVMTPAEAEAAQSEPSILVDLTRPADETGQFAQTPPLRVMCRLMTSRATGLLTISRGDIRKRLHFRDGQPQGCWSNLAADLFGTYLVANKLISDADVTKALAAKARYGGKLGEALVELKLLKPIAVLQHLNKHVRSRVIDLCTWGYGSYSWHHGRPDPKDSFPLGGDSYPMLGEGVMKISDEAIDGWLFEEGSTKLRAVPNSPVPVERFGISGLAELIASLDGTTSIETLLARASKAERARLARILFLVIACDLAVP